MSKEYHTKKHCKYMIKLHIIFITKYRKGLLTGEIDDNMKQIIYDISKKEDSLFSNIKLFFNLFFNLVPLYIF